MTQAEFDAIPVPTTEELNHMLSEMETRQDALTPAERKEHHETVKQRLEAAGYPQPASLQAWLDLSDEDMAWIETRVALSRMVRRQRERAKLTQAALAERLGTGQARIQKAEAGKDSVSLDFMVRSIYAAGGTRGDIAAALSS